MTAKLKVLVVDDEALAHTDLHFMLSAMPEIASVSDCANVTEALGLLQDEAFDVVFLDIQMPGLNGLKAVRIINHLSNPPQIVFVTASDEHAAKAFELDVTDYLIIPFNIKRLAQAVQKVLRIQPALAPETKADEAKSVLVEGNEQAGVAGHFKKIPVEKGDGIMLIGLNEVRYIAAHNDRVAVHTADDQYQCRFSLTELDKRLILQGFVRVHRSYLVNLQHIVELQPFLNGTYNLLIDDKQKSIVPVSRSRVKSLRNLIGV